MIPNRFRFALAGLFAGALMVSLGCEGGSGISAQPTIDLSSQPKAPATTDGGPAMQKVEPVKIK